MGTKPGVLVGVCADLGDDVVRLWVWVPTDVAVRGLWVVVRQADTVEGWVGLT